MIIHGLRTGKARVPMPYADADCSRADHPAAFWITIAVLSLGAAVALSLFARTLH